MRSKITLFSLLNFALMTQPLYAVYIGDRDDLYQGMKNRTIVVSFNKIEPTDLTKIKHEKNNDIDGIEGQLYSRVQTSILSDKILQKNLSITFKDINISKHLYITCNVTNKLLKSFISSSSLNKDDKILVFAVAHNNASDDIKERTDSLDRMISTAQSKIEENLLDYRIEVFNSSENYPDSE